MKNDVFITRSAVFFPNLPISNNDVESYLGLINGKPSRVKNIVLRQNGIKTRYYALNTQQEITHTNAEIAVNSIRRLFDNDVTDQDIDLLTCATTSPDQYLPSHASMVHGLLKNKAMEIFSSSGICLSCIQAFKTAYLALISGDKDKAVCSTSELASPTLLSKYYDIEYEKCSNAGTDPYMAFEKDFLRFMLSDGSSSLLLESHPRGSISLKVEWIDMISFANELPTCMFMGAELREDGELKGWKEFTETELIERSVLVVKQNIRLLKEHIIKYWVDAIEQSLKKHQITDKDINYVIPHVSSMFFYHKLLSELEMRALDLGEDKWFTYLTKVGNIASAAIFAALDEFWKTKPLYKGEKILLLVPESGRFSFGTVLLTVV